MVGPGGSSRLCVCHVSYTKWVDDDNGDTENVSKMNCKGRWWNNVMWWGWPIKWRSIFKGPLFLWPYNKRQEQCNNLSFYLLPLPPPPLLFLDGGSALSGQQLHYFFTHMTNNPFCLPFSHLFSWYSPSQEKAHGPLIDD